MLDPHEISGGKAWLKALTDEIVEADGQYKPDQPWFINLAQNVDTVGKRKVLKRFGDWADADADAVAAHYAYGNDLFCTNDNAVGAGASSIMSKSNRDILHKKFKITFISLDELIARG